MSPRRDHGRAVELERPYFYCRVCREGTYPLDDALRLSAGRIQLDVQQAVADVVTELPYETAATLFGHLSGIAVSSERMHTLTHQVAEGLTVLDVAPSREAIERRVAAVAAGRFRRPVLVLGIDGAYVPTRPESARGRRPGQARQRARRALAASGAKPRGFASTCSMASASSMCSVGIRYKMRSNSARPSSR